MATQYQSESGPYICATDTGRHQSESGAYIQSLQQVSKRAYLSWARLQLPIGRAPVVASCAESVTASASTAAAGGSVQGSTAEVCTAVASASAAGAGIISAIGFETLSAAQTADAFNAVRVYLMWAELQLPAVSVSDSVAETAAPVSTASVIATRVGIVAQPLTSTDVAAAQADFAADGSETLAAAEEASATGGASLGEVDEVETLVDLASAQGGATDAAGEEALTGADSPDAVLVLGDTVEESETLADATDATAAAANPETLASVDTCDVVVVFAGSISDGTASARDLASATALWQLAVVEALSADQVADAAIGITPVFEEQAPTKSRTGLIGGRLGGGTTGRGIVSKLD